MAFGDLITVAQVQTSCPDLDAEDLADVPQIIAAVSAAVSRRYPRAIAAGAFREEFTAGISRTLRLKYRPVLQAGPVECDLAVCLSLANSNPSPARATVEVTTTGEAAEQVSTAVTLRATARGVAAAPVVLTLADYATVGDLAAAVNAAGGGWSATVNPAQADRACAELRPAQGVTSAVGGTADLWAYTRDLNNWSYDPLTGEITLHEWRSQSYSYPDATWGVDPRQCKFRVTYTAGNVTVPPEVQRAAIQLVRFVLQRTADPGAVRSRRTADHATVLASGLWPHDVTTWLSPFKDRGFN